MPVRVNNPYIKERNGLLIVLDKTSDPLEKQRIQSKIKVVEAKMELMVLNEIGKLKPILEKTQGGMKTMAKSKGKTKKSKAKANNAGVKKDKPKYNPYKIECVACGQSKAVRKEVLAKRIEKADGDEDKLRKTYKCMACRIEDSKK